MQRLFALTDANRAYLREWLPWLDRTRAVGDTAGFLELCRAEAEKREAVQCAIWLDGKIVGVIGFHRFDRTNRSTSMGYWLGAAFQGRGVMTRACRALVNHAFTEWNFNRVEIRCAEANQKSRRIPERLGFRNEGTLREAEWLYDHFVDHVIYGMLQRDWKHSGD